MLCGLINEWSTYGLLVWCRNISILVWRKGWWKWWSLKLHLKIDIFRYYLNFCLVAGKKLSSDITFFPVFASSANLASLAIFPPFLPATAFSFSPSASSLSICRVESSASAVTHLPRHMVPNVFCLPGFLYLYASLPLYRPSWWMIFLTKQRISFVSSMRCQNR